IRTATVRERLAAACLLVASLFAPRAVRADDPKPQDVADAVIEKWDQRWTLKDDGAIEYHEIKQVRLNNDRAFGEFADPRITFNKDTDRVDVKVARVKQADGKYVEVPPYSRNEVTPGESAGWPAFASIRQLVLTMSGIEPGCVVELDYSITTKS